MCSAKSGEIGVSKAFVQQIGLDRYADLVAEGEVMEELDIGSAFICKVMHPVVGVVTLLNTAAGHAAMLV